MANLSDIDSLDPHRVSGQREDRVLGDLYLGLTTESKSSSVIPGAAESWRISADGLVYTFTLRKHRWSDGTPVTASNFVYSFRRLIDPATEAPYAPLLYSIKNAQAIHSGKEKNIATLGAVALDPQTLQVTLESQTPYFLMQLTHYSAYPVPQHVIREKGEAWSSVDNIVTNGAYKVVEWKPGNYIKTVKNPYFYDVDNVHVDTVYFHLHNSLPQAVELFLDGKLDAVSGILPEYFSMLKKKVPDEVRVTPYQGVYYYVFNTTRKPFDDARVRQALSLLVDREHILHDMLKTSEMPAYSIVPPGTSNYDDPVYAGWKSMAQDARLKKARALLAAAGVTPAKPINITITYNLSGGWEKHKQIAEIVSGMWKPFGIHAAVRGEEVKEHYANLRGAKFDVARAGWIADYDDPQNFLFLLQTSSGALNYGQYSNEEFDALMEQASRSTETEQRKRLLKKAEAIAMGEQGVMPIFYYMTKQLVSKRVQNWVNNTSDVHRSRWLTVDEMGTASRKRTPKGGQH